MPLILGECTNAGILLPAQVAYVLATVERESQFGRLMNELDDGSRYDGRADLGNVNLGDGPRFKGRGYVQVTGRVNYARWTKKLRALGIAVDLVATPGRATEPNIAAKILTLGMRDGAFTGASLGDFITAARTDFVGARAIVNGQDHAEEIAGNARRYLRCLA